MSSERQRDPRFRQRNRKRFGSIYGYGPKLSFGSSRGGGGSSGSAGTGGGIPPTAPTPNIAQILARDPFYQFTHGQLVAQGISDQASRDAALRRAIIDFGYIPDLPPGALDPATLEALKGVADPTTRSLASQNTAAGLSIWARLQQAAKDQQRDIVNSLGARGMYRSGETGYGLGRAQLAQTQAQSDAIKNVLDYMAGVQAAFVQSQRAQQAADAAAAQQAAQNWDGTYYPSVPRPPGKVAARNDFGIPGTKKKPSGGKTLVM